MIPFDYTSCCFKWGAATVTRAFDDDKTGCVNLLLVTPKYPHAIQIYVTRTGKVRIFSNGEWKEPKKP